MQVALFKGKSLVSLAIRWFTRSQYSHAAFRFDDEANLAAQKLFRDPDFYFNRMHYWDAGAVVEAWSGGVQNSVSISTLHRPGTVVDIYALDNPLNQLEEMKLITQLRDDIGTPYDYRDVIRFVTRQNGHPEGSVFCSFEVFRRLNPFRELFRRTEGWRVTPDMLQRVTALHFIRTVVA